MTRLVAIALALAPLFAVQAQLPQYHAQVFGAEQGIGGGGIADMFKDKQQFLWVVNNASLQRFDGRNVRTYPFERNVRQAICARDNRVWVISGQKVWRNHADKDGFGEMPFDTTGGATPIALFQMPDQPLCVLALNGLFAWRDKEGRFERLPQSPPIPRNYTNLWRFDVCGNTLFYHGKDSVHAYDVTTHQARSLPFGHEIAYMYALTPDLVALTDYNSQTFWFDFARSTAKRLDPRRYGLSEGRTIVGITGAAPLGNGRYLMTSRVGTLVYDLPKDQFTRERIYADGKPLELENLLARVWIDENGTLWAHNVNNIVAAGNLSQTLGLLRNPYPEPPKAWNNRTIGAAADDRGNLWFGGAGGFKKLDLSTGKVTPYHAVENATDRLAHPSVRGMGFDGRYVVVGPTDKGVWLFDPIAGRYRRPVYASDSVRRESERDFIDHLAVLRNGDIVVAGRFHPYRIEATTYRMDFISFPGDSSNMNAVFQDKQGRVWLGSHGAVFCLDENYRLLATYPSENVFCLLGGSTDDELLIGTEKGLRHLSLRAGATRMDTVPTPAEGNGITSMLRDSLQRLWLGSLGGLFLADRNLTVFKKFDFADNIQGLVFNGSSCLQASNGMAFFGGINGINYFYPEKIAMDAHRLSVSIQSVRINDRDSVAWWQPATKFEVPFGQNTLSFEVAAPYFNNAGKVQYRYRLTGQSDEWVSNGVSNQIRLAKLPAGDYRLEVAASITGNVWHEAPEALEFSVLPPFWQTWPFRLGVLAALSGLLFAFVRFRENRLKKQQQAQLELEKLQNTNLLYQLETEQVINYFSRSIAAKSTVEEALWGVAQQCIARLGWEDCVIYLLDAERNVLVQKAAWGQKSAAGQTIVNPIEIPVGQGIVGAVAATGKAELLHDAAADPRYIVDDAARASELAVPILAEGRVIGVIDSEHSQQHFFTPWHLQILTAIASLCSNKIALAQTEEEKRRALLEAVENQRQAAEAKLQSMRLQMNPHFLFNALNSIQQMTLSGNGDGAAMYLSKFSKLLRMVLAHSDHEQVSLREEMAMLRLYLELESLRFDDTFDYTLDCQDALDQDEFKVPPLLIQPFVENAIWHGLLHKEGHRHLKIHFDTTTDDRLRCTIEDNGIGRAAAQTFSRNGAHAGTATRVGNERIETLNRRYGQDNTLEIVDLQDANGISAGTRVVIEFD
ncbi:MAG: histidine kinase [Saprospiraceae bacterium]|nr:histidine kinase [Saprospiraceae bacterium]